VVIIGLKTLVQAATPVIPLGNIFPALELMLFGLLIILFLILEPEGLDDHTVYPNGISTSLPEEVQDSFKDVVSAKEDRERLINPDNSFVRFALHAAAPIVGRNFRIASDQDIEILSRALIENGPGR